MRSHGLNLLCPALVASLTMIGCERGVPAPGVADDTAFVPATAPAENAWRTVDDAQLLALDERSDEGELAVAIGQALESVDNARAIWQAQKREAVSAPNGWAIKWRAPTIDGGVEYVWVEPMAWSPFRIEGRLASPPQRELTCGKSRDDLVGFPAEELVDWVRYANVDFTGTYEGGFTITALDG